jgi:hypothetical protein
VSKVFINPVGHGSDFGEGFNAGAIVYRIEVHPGMNGVRPDLDFMHRGDLFEDGESSVYEIVQARQILAANTDGGLDAEHIIRHVYLAHSLGDANR